MTRNEALGNEYSQKGLIHATAGGFLYDYIAQWHYQMTKEDLKEVLLAVLGVGYDQCHGEEDEEAYQKLILDELESRYFGIEELED